MRLLSQVAVPQARSPRWGPAVLLDQWVQWVRLPLLGRYRRYFRCLLWGLAVQSGLSDRSDLQARSRQYLRWDRRVRYRLYLRLVQGVRRGRCLPWDRGFRLLR